jgi:hypothetical protein
MLAVSDADGNSQGHLWYDPHGSVLSSTLPVTLTQQLLSSQGLDSRLGLVYHGDGRYYDPAIAHTLQPDPFGGVPQLPQTLNRYAVPTAGSVVGQVSPGLHPLLATAAKGASKTAATAIVANPARGALIGLLTAPRPTGWVNLTVRGLRGSFPSSLSGLSLVETYEGMTLGEGMACLLGCGDMGLRLRLFGSSVQDTIRRGLGLQPVWETRAGRVFLPDMDELAQVEVLAATTETRAALSATPALWLKHGLGMSWAVGLNVLVQYLGDVGDPFLTPEQRNWRLFSAGAGGGTGGYLFVLGAQALFTAKVGAVLGIEAGPAGVVVGSAAGFIYGLVYFGFVQPQIVFPAFGLGSKRNLAPLQS